MKTKSVLQLALIVILGAYFSSCKKDSTVVSTPELVIGQQVSDATPLSGSLKGTMLSGKTYTMGGNVTINKGDTLLMQSGVTLKVGKGLTILVKGAFVSLGTKDKPNWITTAEALAKTDNVGADPSTDKAYTGYWTGIQCDTSCRLLDLKWTHIEYTGGSFGADFFPTGEAAGNGAKGILFQNPNGNFILEDSWCYGTIDDMIRVSQGHFSIMRNTFEKCGFTGGDAVNVKGSSVGDMAYNLFVGTATNATKASNKSTKGVQTNVNMYNNTYISGGYRQKDPTGRGGSINYEEGAKGSIFNNLMVNCRVGVRIHNKPHADITNMKYGYNYNYGDSLRVCNNFYPVDPTTSVTVPQPTDIPTPTEAIFPAAKYSQAFLYVQNASGDCPNIVAPYDGSSFVKQNNPKFVNFPLPETGIAHLSDVSAVGSFDFHLQSSSPAIGKGTNNSSIISPINATSSVTDANLKATVTLPGADMGCFQSNGTGNQH
jgi:hypothetical protein